MARTKFRLKDGKPKTGGNFAMNENGWNDEKPPMTIEEKAESEKDEPIKVNRKDGQYLIWPGGREEKLTPDHPLFR